MNLYDLMMGAQGGRGVDTLASQFRLTPQQTQAALQAMMPAFSLGLQNLAQNPMGLAALFSQMANGAHLAAYANPMQIPAAGLGGDLIGQIFGSPSNAQQIARQAAHTSGVAPQAIQQMMPLVASMLMGGLTQAMSAQGLTSMVTQLADAFTTAAGLEPPPQPPPTLANPVALWTSWIEGFTGAGKPTPQKSPALQSTLTTLNSLMQAGVAVSAAQRQALNNMLQSISNAAKATKV